MCEETHLLRKQLILRRTCLFFESNLISLNVTVSISYIESIRIVYSTILAEILNINLH